MGRKKKNIQSGARIIVDVLIEQGVKTVFGYPGAQVLDIYDELEKSRDKIEHILTAHEQGASHAADGYSRVTGEVGVCLATSGPGATNLVTGIATAMLDSIPMVAITGNVPSMLVGKDSFQEINITGITMPITKHNYFVTDVRELADTIREAFVIAKSGRPGPVLIDVPKDVQVDKCEFLPKGPVEAYENEIASDELIDKAVEMINAAKRPYIYIGGGAAAQGMTGAIMRFAEKTDAYIGCTFMGISAMPNSYERYLGMHGMHGKYASNMAKKNADLILGIGIRFSDRATIDLERHVKGAKIIQLDVDLSEINKNVIVDLGIIGDIRSSFLRIAERCEAKKRGEWGELIDSFKADQKLIDLEIKKRSENKFSPEKIFEVINEIKTKETVIVTDVGQHQMWTAQHIMLEKPRRLASSGGLGTMGYGLGAAIGAIFGGNDKAVLITGDGSFGMNLNELATAVTYNTPVIVVIFNNGVLGMVRQWQTMFFEKRYSNTVLRRSTDFVLLAEAFGAKAKRAHDAESFREAFSEAFLHDGPYVIDVVIDSDELVLPMTPPVRSVDDTTKKKEDGE